MMTLNEMEQLMINHNDVEYPDIFVDFKFAGKEYRTSINYAYLNSCLDEIYTRYNLPHDESWMWLKALNAQAFKEMDNLIERLYYLSIDKMQAEHIVMDVVDLISKIINLIDSGKRASLDISLMGIANDILTKPEVKDLLYTDFINDDMTPYEIMDKKKEILEKLKTSDIYGVSELLRSDGGAKADQVFNCMIGLWLRVRVHDMHEIAPKIIYERWLDGIKTVDAKFIETNVNRQAYISSKQGIQDSGKENKNTGVLSQDIIINNIDCGTIHYVTLPIHSVDDLKRLHRKYRVLPNGTLKVITPLDTNLIGETIKVRSILKCNNKIGICANCFGQHANWNKNTDKYRKDIGSEFVKSVIASVSQAQLSIKHTITPVIIPVEYSIINTSTGEITNNIDDFVTFKFNKIIPKPGVDILLRLEDITNSRRTYNGKSKLVDGDIVYKDREYGDYDIIRTNRVYFLKDGIEYDVTLHTVISGENMVEKQIEFKIDNFSNFNYGDYEVDTVINLAHKESNLYYVIPNKSKVHKYDEVKRLYSGGSVNHTNSGMIFESVDDLVMQTINTLPYIHFGVIEVMFRNRIKTGAYGNLHFRPDWSKPDAEESVVILPELKAIGALRSLSVKLGLGGAGQFRKKIYDPFYYDERNLIPSTYDLLFDSDEEITKAETYTHASEEDIEDMIESWL